MSGRLTARRNFQSSLVAAAHQTADLQPDFQYGDVKRGCSRAAAPRVGSPVTTKMPRPERQHLDELVQDGADEALGTVSS